MHSESIGAFGILVEVASDEESENTDPDSDISSDY